MNTNNTGAVIGGILGFIVGGPAGALIGAVAGGSAPQKNSSTYTHSRGRESQDVWLQERNGNNRVYCGKRNA